MAEKSIKKNIVFNMLKTIMSLLFPLITFPYASRILLPDGIGKVNFANSIVSYFGIVASLGIGMYGMREAAKVKHDRKLLSQFVMELFVFNCISTVIAYLLFFIAIIFIPRLSDYRILLLVCGTTILFSTFGIEWLYGALEEYRYIALRSVFIQFLSLGLLFLLVKAKTDYILYAAIGVIASVGANICNLVHALKFVDFNFKFRLNIKRHIKPVFILFSSTIAMSVFTILDTSMLGFLSTDEQVGYYSAATKLIHMIRNLFPAVFTVMFARLSIYADTNNIEKFKYLTNNAVIFLMGVSFPIIAGLYILAEPIIFILSGSAYLPALPSMYMLIPIVFFSSCAGFVGGSILTSIGKEKVYLICVVIGAVANFILNIALIPTFGASGASIATLITELLLCMIYIYINRSFIFSANLYKNFFQYVFATLMMTAVCLLVNNFLDFYILKLICVTSVGIATYFLCLLILKNELLLRFLFIFHEYIKRGKHEKR